MSSLPELAPYEDEPQRRGSREPIEGRSPIVAGLLSIIPGAGHAYLGLIANGVAHFIAVALMVLLILWARTTHEFEAFTGMLVVLTVLVGVYWLWVIVSAVLLASRSRVIVRSLGVTVLLLFTYLMGWQATEVNLNKFFTEFSDTFNIFTRIMWPWEAAVERDVEMNVTETGWASPCEEGEIPEQTQTGEQWITIEPACGVFAEYVIGEGVKAGTEVTLRGAGFMPDEPIEIWMMDPIGGDFRPRVDGEPLVIEPDSQGNFEVTYPSPQFRIPGYAEGVQQFQVQARQVASVGPLLISEDFKLAGGRMIITIFQALMATSFGVILAVPLSFLAAQNLMKGNPFTYAIYYAVRFLMNIARSIEPLIWAVIATVWVGLGPFAGVIALTIHTIAALGKLYSEAIESIQPGPIEAITATGANRLQVIMYGIVPQIIPPFLSFTIYRWDINVRMSTIIGFVGGGGIGQVLFQWINQTRWASAGMAVWLIAITVALMDYASAEFRKRFV
jgi:phosphonate transport system permease protein